MERLAIVIGLGSPWSPKPRIIALNPNTAAAAISSITIIFMIGCSMFMPGNVLPVTWDMITSTTPNPAVANIISTPCTRSFIAVRLAYCRCGPGATATAAAGISTKTCQKVRNPIRTTSMPM